MYLQAHRLLIFASKPDLNKTTEAVGVADSGCTLACFKHKHTKSK